MNMIPDSVAISIIVPIYNAEGFLKETIESILSQSFSNFELLLINDGSTDQSQLLCENYLNLDQRVKLINKDNGGVSSARNSGIKNAKGTFVYHVDADDVLSSNALMHMYNHAIKTNTDITVANYIVRYANNDEKVIKQTATQSSEEFLQGMLLGKYHAGLWNKLIRKSCYQDLFFDEEVNCMEDKLILTQMLLKWPTLSFLDFEVYTYIQRSTSITNNINARTIASVKRVIDKIDYLLHESKIFSAALVKMKLDFKIKLLNNTEEKEQLINEFSEVNNMVFLNGMIPIYYRILLWLEIHNISFLTRIFKHIR